jgi:hypothetical protein
MSRLIRLDRSGHTMLAEWSATDQAAYEIAVDAFAREIGLGMIASATTAAGAEVVRELPRDAELVVMRRQIAGG